MRTEPIDSTRRILQLTDHFDETFVTTDDREGYPFGKKTVEFTELEQRWTDERSGDSGGYGENESEICGIVSMTGGRHQMKMFCGDEMIVDGIA